MKVSKEDYVWVCRGCQCNCVIVALEGKVEIFGEPNKPIQCPWKFDEECQWKKVDTTEDTYIENRDEVKT